MSVTYYSSNLVLDRVMGGVAFTPPSFYYFALSTTAPAIDGTGFTEPSIANSYARVQVANTKSSWTTAASGALENSIAITFPESTGTLGWGAIVAVGMFDSATVGAGNLWWYDTLTPNRTVASATTVLFSIGSVDVVFNNS